MSPPSLQSAPDHGMNFNIVSSGLQFIRKSSLQPSYQEFYQEARQRFDLRWEQSSETAPMMVTTEDLVLLKNISLGQFGNGSLMQHRKSKNYFLMKTLNKRQIISEGNLDSLRNEKKLLLCCNFPFIANLLQCICDRSSVHLLYEWSVEGEGHFRRELGKFIYFPRSRSDWHLTGCKDRVVTTRFMSCSQS